jgi:hypothetical protein
LLDGDLGLVGSAAKWKCLVHVDFLASVVALARGARPNTSRRQRPLRTAGTLTAFSANPGGSHQGVCRVARDPPEDHLFLRGAPGGLSDKARRFLDREGMPFLQKPLANRDELVALIRSLAGRGADRPGQRR